MPNDEFVSTLETARLMGLSPSGVSRRVRRGVLTPVTKAPGIRGAYFFRRAEVEALVRHESAGIPHQQSLPSQAIPA